MTTILKVASRRLLIGALFAVAYVAMPVSVVPAFAAPCVGDCNNNGAVAVNELILGVNISLEKRDLSECPGFDRNGNGVIAVNELILGVNSSLDGCEVAPTATPSEPVATPTPGCPISAGAYTLTQVEGGTLAVGTIADFPFPAGGEIKMDVSEGDADCVHEAIVPADGGLTTPVFCIQALTFSVKVAQAGCGVGRIDSNGGSDFTVTEVGDSSDTTDCNIPQDGCIPGLDSSVRNDITVGDGTPDECTGGGTGNAIVAIPVFTTTWSDAGGCPAPDGEYNPGTDALIVEFPQILDFTTSSNTARWEDIDGDFCSVAGTPLPNTMASGACLDVSAGTVTTAAAGPIGSSGAPLFDILFRTTLPNMITGPDEPLGATCDPAPVIDFAGTATRCIQ